MDTASNDLEMMADYEIDEWKADTGEAEDKQKNPGPPIRKIFVGNLSTNTTSYQLRRLFRAYGEVIEAFMARDRITYGKKRYGFVTFKNPEDAERALKVSGNLILHRKTIYTAPADDRHQPVELPDGTVVWHPQLKEKTVDSSTVCKKAAAGDEAAGECFINMLNDDCLRHVFSFLNKTERVRIERVCKRWQALTLEMWLCQTHFDFSGVMSHNFKKVLSMNVLTAFLKRCGENLKSLDVSHKPNSFTANVPTVIGIYCKKLHTLDLSGLPLTTYSLKRLLPVCGNLKSLWMNSCSGGSDKDYTSLFKAAPLLETVSLAHNRFLSGKCLFGLTRTSVRHLVLDGCNNLQSKFLGNALRELKYLTHLSLNACISLSTSDISVLASAVPSLLSLSMAHYFPLVQSKALCNVASLVDLLCLNLQQNPAVNDDVMIEISNNCKNLEDLDITGCSVSPGENDSLTGTGVKCLARLRKLKRLKMSYLAFMSDDCLEDIACKCSLRELVCRGIPGFTDVGCSRIITCCNDLELFDFSGCDYVSKKTVEVALDAVKLRTNNLKLKLVVGGTCIRKEEITDTHNLLELDFMDLCIHHLRPDYVDDIYFHENNFDYLYDFEYEYSDSDSYSDDSDDSDYKDRLRELIYDQIDYLDPELFSVYPEDYNPFI